MNLKQINNLLEEVGKLDGIQGLQLAPDGTGGMKLKSDICVYFEYLEKDAKLCIYTPLAAVPQDEKKRLIFFGVLLEHNFSSMDGGSLSVARHLGQATYQICLDTRTLEVNRLDEAIDMVLKRRESILPQLNQLLQQAENGIAHVSIAANAARQRFMAMNRITGIKENR